MKKQFIGLTVICLLSVGCKDPGNVTNQEVGTAFGAITGGLIGTQFGKGGRTAAIIGGALVGSMLGSNVGSSLDTKDKENVSNVLEEYTKQSFTLLG